MPNGSPLKNNLWWVWDKTQKDKFKWLDVALGSVRSPLKDNLWWVWDKTQKDKFKWLIVSLTGYVNMLFLLQYSKQILNFHKNQT